MSVRNIDDAFIELHSRLTPSGTETELAKSHRQTIESCLKNNFSVLRFFRSGSFGNGTSIRGYSDVDYFVSIKRSDLKDNSNYTLEAIRDALVNTFSKTTIKVDNPSVVLYFGDGEWERTEVTPADYIKGDVGEKIYDIPDGDKGWMRSSPDLQNKYVSDINEEKYYKVKKLIRFLKAWKYYNNVPILSFYIEMYTARYAKDEKSIIYSMDIKNILKNMLDSELRSMQEPTDVGGYIQPCKSDPQKLEALSKLKTAYNRAYRAREYEREGKIQEAFDKWDLFFNGNFPSHYY